MALWTCAGCSTHFAVGLPACPQCSSTDHHEEGVMPKITIHGGASNDAAVNEWANLPAAEAPATPEEEPSPGNSSATSSPKAEPKQQPNGSSSRSRARKTASPSDKAQTDSSTARGTAGAPTTDGGE